MYRNIVDRDMSVDVNPAYRRGQQADALCALTLSWIPGFGVQFWPDRWPEEWREIPET